MGRHYTYVGTEEGKKAVDKVVVSDRTRVIDGAECRLVEDKLYLDGVLEERTTDYYTQAADGAVWYYGEDTAELGRTRSWSRPPRGRGWQGCAALEAGIMMPAAPRVGQSMAQERDPGRAAGLLPGCSTFFSGHVTTCLRLFVRGVAHRGMDTAGAGCARPQVLPARRRDGEGVHRQGTQGGDS